MIVAVAHQKRQPGYWTEPEANAKAILLANGYTKSGNFNVTDYYSIF
jgi:hypothetical protein